MATPFSGQSENVDYTGSNLCSARNLQAIPVMPNRTIREIVRSLTTRRPQRPIVKSTILALLALPLITAAASGDDGLLSVGQSIRKQFGLPTVQLSSVTQNDASTATFYSIPLPKPEPTFSPEMEPVGEIKLVLDQSLVTTTAAPPVDLIGTMLEDSMTRVELTQNVDFATDFAGQALPDVTPEAEPASALPMTAEESPVEYIACPTECPEDECTECPEPETCCPPLCGCDPCRSRLWVRAELLMMWTNGFDIPSLVTTSTPGTPASNLGVLGAPTTQSLFGQQTIGDNLRFGGRINAGYWLDPCRRIGLMGDFFALGNGGQNFSTSLPNDTPLARPFFNTDTGMQDSQILNLDGLASGTVNYDFDSQIFSAGPALRLNLCCCGNPCDSCACQHRTDAILGYRYFGLREDVNATEVLMSTDPLDVPGTLFELNDSIEVENEFHGVEFGLNRMGQKSRWFYEVQATVALGQVTRRATLNGSSRRFVPDLLDSTVPGGFLVPPQNIGTFVDRDFAALPQVRANFGYCLSNGWRAYAGYNFAYLSRVSRVGDFLNPTFAGSELATGASTAASNVGQPASRGLFLHGVTLGIGRNF